VEDPGVEMKRDEDDKKNDDDQPTPDSSSKNELVERNNEGENI